jgi:23S rRNA (adenine2503-C2)-methyltransferase
MAAVFRLPVHDGAGAGTPDDVARAYEALLPKGVSRRAMQTVREVAPLTALTQIAAQASSEDPFVKYVFRAADHSVFESVRIPLHVPGRFSVCVSSQVGCALGCRFCATGRMGLLRNLEAWEIVDQVRQVRAGLPRATAGAASRISGVVFQGMGEPCSNLDRVLQAIAVLSDPCTLAIDARNITVTTAGLAPGIRRLADEAPNVRLGWSLGSARPDVRRRLMPITERHSFDDVFDACVYHANKTGMSPLWAVTPLAGVNDTREDAEAIARAVERFTQATGRRPRLTVVPYNTIGEGDPFARQTEGAETAFRDQLASLGAAPKKRYSGGADVRAACGQLAIEGQRGRGLLRASVES